MARKKPPSEPSGADLDLAVGGTTGGVTTSSENTQKAVGGREESRKVVGGSENEAKVQPISV